MDFKHKHIIGILFLLFCFFNAFSQTNNELEKLTTEKQLIENKLALIDSLLAVQLQVTHASPNQLIDSVLLDSLETQHKIIIDRKGFPVNPFNDTLFFIYASIGSFTAKDRALAINDKITDFIMDPFFIPDSLVIIKSYSYYELVYKSDLSVLTVTPIDASISKTNQEKLSNLYLNLIQNEIQNEKQKQSSGQLLIRFGWAILIIFILIILWRLVNFSLKKLTDKLLANEMAIENKFPLSYFKSLTGLQLKTFLSKAINIARMILILILLSVALTSLFNVFPITKIFTKTILGWVLNPAKAMYKGIVDYLPNLFTIIVIVFVFKYLLKLIRFFAVEISNKHINVVGFYSDWAMTTYNIVRILLIAFSLVIIFPLLPGFNSIAFKGVSVFIGVIFSFGSSTAISNMVAGIVLTYMRAYKVGDRIKIGDITGDVIEKTTLVTRIRTIKNEEITVPNANILTTNTVNYSSNTGPDQKGLILHTTVTIGYSVPWQAIEGALINAALRTQFVLSDPQPFVFQTALNDFFVSYQINVYTHHANEQFKMYSDLHKNIQDCCNEAGIEILSPHYRAMRDGNAMALPENYLDKDYKSPAFKVNLNHDDASLKR